MRVEHPEQELVEKRVEQTYWTVLLRGDGVAVLLRKAVPFPSIAELHVSYDDFLAVVDDWLFERRIKSGQLGKRVRTRFAWLFDLRDGPEMRNDPAFEEAVKARRPELLERSPILGLLVQTSAGQMQLHRITQQAGGSIGVFSEALDANEWLLRRLREVFR